MLLGDSGGSSALPHLARVDPAELATADRLVADCLAMALTSESLLAGATARLDQLAAAGQARRGHAEQQQQQQQQQRGSLPEAAAGKAPAPHPPRRGAASKRKRSAAAAGDPSGDATASKLGTGLRHFSLKVCLRVEAMGQTTYNDVADELVAEIAAEAAAGALLQTLKPRLCLTRLTEACDEKNIRRRAYDVLNVLEAVGMVSKAGAMKRDITWLGWPSQRGGGGGGRDNSDGLARRARAERKRGSLLGAVRDKQALLKDLAGKAFCLCNLALRNRTVPLPVLQALRDRGLAGLNPLPPPFLLVRAGADACVDVQISTDQRQAMLDFHDWPFLVYDDGHIFQSMGLHVPQPQLLRLLAQAGFRLTPPPAPAQALAAALGRQQQQAAAEEGGTRLEAGPPQPLASPASVQLGRQQQQQQQQALPQLSPYPSGDLQQQQHQVATAAAAFLSPSPQPPPQPPPPQQAVPSEPSLLACRQQQQQQRLIECIAAPPQPAAHAPPLPKLSPAPEPALAAGEGPPGLGLEAAELLASGESAPVLLPSPKIPQMSPMVPLLEGLPLPPPPPPQGRCGPSGALAQQVVHGSGSCVAHAAAPPGGEPSFVASPVLLRQAEATLAGSADAALHAHFVHQRLRKLQEMQAAGQAVGPGMESPVPGLALGPAAAAQQAALLQQQGVLSMSASPSTSPEISPTGVLSAPNNWPLGPLAHMQLQPGAPWGKPTQAGVQPELPTFLPMHDA